MYTRLFFTFRVLIDYYDVETKFSYQILKKRELIIYSNSTLGKSQILMGKHGQSPHENIFKNIKELQRTTLTLTFTYDPFFFIWKHILTKA